MKESARVVSESTGKPLPPPGPFNPWKQFLVGAGVLADTEAEVIQKVYNHLSVAGAHALGSEREQVKVNKNTVIEWALMLLGRIEPHRPATP